MNAPVDLTALGLSHEARAARRLGIGGSDANTIMSGDDERIIRLWREKRGEVEPEDLSDVLAVQMGLWTETLNCAWFEKVTGERVTRRGDIVQRGSFMRATLDGIVGNRVFEAKHCGTRSSDAELWARYVPQLAHNAWCARMRGAVLSCFKGNGDWMMLEYEHDDAYVEALLAAEAEFWSCVQSGEPPRPLPPPPAPKPKGVREVDMGQSNAWAFNAGEYRDTLAPAQRHEAAKKALKELVEPDVTRAFGAGLEIKRDKRGALRFALNGEAS